MPMTPSVGRSHCVVGVATGRACVEPPAEACCLALASTQDRSFTHLFARDSSLLAFWDRQLAERGERVTSALRLLPKLASIR